MKVGKLLILRRLSKELQVSILRSPLEASQQGESNQQGVSSNKSETPQQKAPVKQEPQYNEPAPMDFEDEIPF